MPAEPTNKTILIIDDDREIAAMLMGVLQSNGHRVVHAQNGVEGQRQIEAIKPDLVITDMMMPRMGGFPVLEFLKTLEDGHSCPSALQCESRTGRSAHPTSLS